MSDEPKITNSTGAEPSATGTTVPLWLIGVMFVLFFWGALTFDLRGGWFSQEVYSPYDSPEQLAHFQPLKGGDAAILGRGKILFESNCALCHGSDGMGKPGQAPPMAGSEWIIAEGVNRLVRIPSVGLSGPLEVKGQQYNMSMAAMGASYSHDDLAAVLSYIRNSWGNKASIVTPEQVASVRGDLAGRSQPYSMDELKKLPEKEK